MLAGDGDDDAVAKSVEPITECSTAVGSGTVSLPQSEPQPASSPQPATEVNNPYAYLSYLTSDQSDGKIFATGMCGWWRFKSLLLHRKTCI